MVTNRLEKHWSAPTLDDQQEIDSRQESALPAWLQSVEQVLAEHPRTVVATALLLGVALGWLGKRK